MENKEAIKNLTRQEIEDSLKIIRKEIDEDAKNKSPEIQKAAKKIKQNYEGKAVDIMNSLDAGEINSAKKNLDDLQETAKEMTLMKKYRDKFNEF